MPRIKIIKAPKVPKAQFGFNSKMLSGLATIAENANKEDAKEGRLASQQNYNPFDIKWGQRQDPGVDITGEYSNKPFDQYATSSKDSKLFPTLSDTPMGGKGVLNVSQLTTPQQKPTFKSFKIADEKKKKYDYDAIGNDFLNMGSALSSYVDNQKKKKQQDEMQANAILPDNFYAVNKGSDRGWYEKNDGMFDPYNMGYKGRREYGGMIKAAAGITVAGDYAVHPAFIPDAPNPYTFLPSATRSAAPVYTQSNEEQSSGDLREIIAAKESGGNYKALPKNKDGTLASSAVGKYQFLWNQNKDWIQEVTGVDTKTGFMNNPQAQEKAFDYWDQTVLTPNAMKIKKELGVNAPIENIKYAIHFAGPTGAYRYFSTGQETNDVFGTSVGKIMNMNLSNNSQRGGNALNSLTGFAKQNNFDVTSTTGGKHNKGSKHYSGNAIDVRTNNKSPEEIASFIADAQQQGFRVLDERQRPAGQAVWSGPHLHLEKSELGGQNKNQNNMKIRIVGVPGEKTQMAGGGQPPYSGQTDYGLYIGQRNLYRAMPKDPYMHTNESMSEEQESEQNPHVLEAEGGETIKRPDGSHMEIRGKRHTEGGVKLTKEQAPEGSFIFSDTRKMKIKDPETLKHFGKSGSKALTPAELAKQYDTNKYRGILADPNTDNLQKNTAKRMLDAYDQKLAELALIQESKKGFPQGIPDIAKPLMERMNAGKQQQQAPQEEQNPEEMQEQPPMQRYGGGLRRFQGNVDGSTVPPYINVPPYSGGIDPGDIGGFGKIANSPTRKPLPSWYKPWTQSNTKAGRTSPKGPESTYNYVQGNDVYDDYQYWRDRRGQDFNGAADYQRYVFDEIQKGNPAAYDYMAQKWGPTSAGRWDDAIMGARTMFASGSRIPPPPSKTPPPETPPPPPGTPPSPPVVPPATTTTTIQPGDYDSSFTEIPYGWTQQDINNRNAAVTNLSLMKPYYMNSRVIQPDLPEFVPVDWRGQAAAFQSAQNAASNQLGAYLPGQSMASNLSALAGQQAENLGKAISGVDQYNAQGKTASDLQRSNMLNQFTQYNAGKKDYDMDYNNTADSKFRAGYAHGLDRLTAANNQGITNAGLLYDMNLSESPEYYISPRYQTRKFNSKQAQYDFMNRNRGGYQADDAASQSMADKVLDLKKRGISEENAIKILGIGTGAGKTTNMTYPANPMKNRISTTMPNANRNAGAQPGYGGYGYDYSSAYPAG